MREAQQRKQRVGRAQAEAAIREQLRGIDPVRVEQACRGASFNRSPDLTLALALLTRTLTLTSSLTLTPSLTLALALPLTLTRRAATASMASARCWARCWARARGSECSTTCPQQMDR